jgi:multiple sugar transport system substrate-binding protein
LWYWKDLLNEANVDPNLLKTWDGYIVAAKKLNEKLRATGIEGVHLTGANHSPDLWYPYLWMLGGEILELRVATRRMVLTGSLFLIVAKEYSH